MPKKFGLLIAFLILVSVLAAGCTSAQPDKSGQSGQAVPGKPTESKNSNPKPKSDSKAALLNEIMQSAGEGKTINCEFSVESSNMGTIEEKWGEPDRTEYIAAAKGTYATYAQNYTIFGFNKGMQIFDVRSYAQEIKAIKMSEVKEVLGTPDNTHQYKSEDMLVYKAGEHYQLLFMFPKATKHNPDPRLDHYNVFYPEGTVNSMADDPGIKY